MSTEDEGPDDDLIEELDRAHHDADRENPGTTVAERLEAIESNTE